MFPSLYLKNQFGEQSNNFIIGGSAALSAQFTVAPADVGGKGITGLVARGISDIFMHTSQTPASGNPNPANGMILVKLTDKFISLLKFGSSIASPNSGTPINISSGLAVGTLYVITAVGTSTAANWQALGLPVGITPAIGAMFVATSASAGTGTGAVQIPLAAGAGVSHLELVGDASKTMNPSAGNGYLYVRTMGQGGGTLTMNSYTPAGTNDMASPPIFTGTPAVLTGSVGAGAGVQATPAVGTIITLDFSLLPVAASLI